MSPPLPFSPSSVIPHLPPVWADVFGEDDFGIFAECEVGGVRFVWRWICPGRFQMGCDPQDEHGYSWEEPQHQVVITGGYWLGETPVTQAQWRAVMGSNPSQFKGDQRPVEKVSWQDSRDFITKLNALLPGLHAALPSEAQWEYACRAETRSAYHDGSACSEPTGKDPALDKLGWFNENSAEGFKGKKQTHDVKLKAANAWGLHDMHGNVWEWCRDAWKENAYKSRHDGIQDPEERRDAEGTARVVRGGSWSFPALDCRAAVRNWGHTDNRWNSQGLRLAAGQELAEPPQEKERSDLP